MSQMWGMSVLCLAASVAGASGFSSGAPDAACKDMIPQHHVEAQRSAPPYTVTTSSNKVFGGQPVQVTIQGAKPTDTIKGFLLQARHEEDIVGQFHLPPGDKNSQLTACGESGNAVTHQKHQPGEKDKQTITATWTPSQNIRGQIKFRATVALNGGKFWVGIESAPVFVA